MRAERVASAALIVAPWAAFAWPAPTLLASLVASLVVAAAVAHGFGRALALGLDRSARRSAVATMCLGTAVVLLVGGALAAIHRLDEAAQLGVLVTGLALHTGAVAYDFRRGDLVARARAAFSTLDVSTALAWFVLLALLALHVFGLLASQHGPAYDDDGHWFAAVKRLRDTGAFHDPVGYGGAYQLGGSVVSSLFAATVDDVSCTRVAEALGFILTFAGLARLALSSHDRTRAGAMIFLLLVLALSSKAQAEFDSSLFWLPSAGFVAVFSHLLARHRSPEPRRGDVVWLVILLAGICSIRLEYLSFALVLGAIAAPAARWRDRAREVVVIGAGSALCLAPMLVAWRLHRDLDHSKALARFGPLVVTLAVALIVSLLPRGRRPVLAVFSYTIAIAAAITSVIRTPAGAFSQRMLWLPIFSLLFVSLAALAQAQWAPRAELFDLRRTGTVRWRYRFTTGAMLVFATLAFIMRAQDSSVRMSWRLRFRTWIEDVAELAVSDAKTTRRDPYATVLRQAPTGSAVLTWVAHPELLDFSAHDFFDLRVPRHNELRTFKWFTTSSALRGLAAATGARYLLVEDDMEYLQRAKDSAFYAFWCTPQNGFADPVLHRPSGCADPLEQALVDHATIASADGVSLVDLSRDR